MNFQIKVRRYRNGELPRATAQIVGTDGEYAAIMIKRLPTSHWMFYVKGNCYAADTLKSAIAQWRIMSCPS